MYTQKFTIYDGDIHLGSTFNIGEDDICISIEETGNIVWTLEESLDALTFVTIFIRHRMAYEIRECNICNPR